MIGRRVFRAATRRDLGVLTDRLVDGGLFGGPVDVAQYVKDHPWAIQLSDSHPALTYGALGVWRTGTPMAAIRLFVARPRDRRPFLSHLTDIAKFEGFELVLSPFVDDAMSRLFRKSGFHERERLVVLKKRGLDFVPVKPACDTRELASSDDEAVAAIDAACFDDMWRFRPADVAAILRTVRGFVAVQEGRPIGYNMVSVSREAGTVGRLAVHPDYRNRGVGSTLLAAGLNWLREAGGTEVSLCTQNTNLASRRLYRRFGFQPLPDELSIMQKDL